MDVNKENAAVSEEALVHPKWSVSKLGIATIGDGSIKLDGFTFYSAEDCQPKMSDVMRAVRDWIDGTLEQEILKYQEKEANPFAEFEKPFRMESPSRRDADVLDYQPIDGAK